MTVLTCPHGECDDIAACFASGDCARAGRPVVTTTGPTDAAPPKRIDEYTLDDYRRGPDRAMAHLWRERA